MKNKMDIGVIGLSVMGSNLALNLADHGFQAVGFNRSRGVTEKLMAEQPHRNLSAAYTMEEFVEMLSRPRRIMMMIKAGPPVDAVIRQIAPLLEPGDVLMDGGNTFFEETQRRQKELADKGILYLGVGISGGSEGARKGPSIMPGGAPEAYAQVRPMLEAIAAKAKGEPCCAYMGPGGAGHYVKMVHNGIEYADMQLIAEAYLVLKYAGGLTNAEMAEVFEEWNEGELESYLIGITAKVLREKDDLAGGDLVDHILDSAGQKGTGRWASIEALKQGVDLSMINAAANARVLSGDMDRRSRAGAMIPQPAPHADTDRKTLVDTVRQALYTGKIMAYAQGFALLKSASESFGWSLDYGTIASIFRAGCIIQARFLDDMTKAYREDPQLDNLLFAPFFAKRVKEGQSGLRGVVTYGIMEGIPMPALSGAIAYLDSFRAAATGANLIQAQRDFFGAHTYGRNDRPGIFHHDWRS